MIKILRYCFSWNEDAEEDVEENTEEEAEEETSSLTETDEETPSFLLLLNPVLCPVLSSKEAVSK